MKALSSAAPWLRRQLGERLHLRHVPQLSIRHDDSIESGDRVLRILREIEAGTATMTAREGGRRALREAPSGSRRSATRTRTPTRWARPSPRASPRNGSGKAAEVVSRRPAAALPGRPAAASTRCANAPGSSPTSPSWWTAGDLARTGASGARAAPSGCRGRASSTSTTTSRTTAARQPSRGSTPTAAATCEMVALLLPELGVRSTASSPRCCRRHRPGHAHLRAPERDAAHPARHGRSAGGRGAAVRPPPRDLRRQAVRARSRCGAGC